MIRALRRHHSRPSEPPASRVGEKVAGRFVIEAQAGTGSSGVVFRAKDRRTGKTVALKTLHVGREQQSERTFREARALAAVQHPGVVAYVAHGSTDQGEAYIAMEWIEGETLADRLADRGLTPIESLLLVRRLSSALAALHARGIVHRDLKPSNILLAGNRVQGACIIDLGVARDLNASVVRTGEGSYVGTPRYMSPEQIRDPQCVRGQSDVFALGCILYECLCGAPAFDAGEVFAVLAQILFAPSPSVRVRRPELPAELESLMSAMLERHPERRPEAGGALDARLMAAIAGASAETLAQLAAPQAVRVREPASAQTAESQVRAS